MVYDDQFYREAEPQVTLSHSMNAGIGVLARKAFEKHIESSEKLERLWRTASDDKLHSVDVFVQIYSDKSQTSLTADGFLFRLLHLTLLKVSEKLRTLSILSESGGLGYFSTQR